MKMIQRARKSPTPAELRRQIKKGVDSLPDRVIPSIADIIDGLESVEATRELLETPGMLESHRRGLKDSAEGRTTPWRKVLRDV